MSERLNLVVEPGIGEMMADLADGERRRGAWLSDLVRAMTENRQKMTASDLDALRLGFAGLIAEVKMQDARLARVEHELAALIAKSQPDAH